MSEIVQAGIAPHGGRLINRVVPPEARREVQARAERLPSIQLSTRAANDLLLLATGAFSPLEGLMNHDSARSVVQDLALPDGTLWPLPVLLQVEPSEVQDAMPGQTVALRYAGSLLGTLQIEERFAPPRDWTREMFKTQEEAHPGVAAYLSAGGMALAGP